MTNHNAAPTTPETSFQNEQRVQFRDGRIALGYGNPGDVIEWGGKKYADPEGSRIDTILIKTSLGRRVAIGQGVIVQLPEFNPDTGKYEAGETSGSTLENLPTGLTDITIGQPWDVIGYAHGEVIQSVMLDYKSMSPGEPGYTQLDIPNPFDPTKAILEQAAVKLGA